MSATRSPPRSRDGPLADAVADTHALVWHLTEPRRLGRAARKVFDAADAGRVLCHVPAIALAEVWLLYERGRLSIGPMQMLAALADRSGYAVLPMDVAQVVEFGSLTGVKDPMDRLVIAAARSTRGKLVSADVALDGWGVDRVWN